MKPSTTGRYSDETKITSPNHSQPLFRKHYIKCLFVLLILFNILSVLASDVDTTTEKKKVNVGFNFAAEESGAKILSSNPEAKKTSRILNEDSDKYCLIPRNAPKKWIIVELSEEILMKSIALANFEYYSCSFKHFKVFASVKYPCKGEKCWELVGSFQAHNTRKVQTFIFKKPTITRYIKLEFLSHYGESEYYCTLSLLRVHGSTLLEDLKKSLQKSSKKNEESDHTIDTEVQKTHESKTRESPGKEETNDTVEGDLNRAILQNMEHVHQIAVETDTTPNLIEVSLGKLLNDDLSNIIQKQFNSSIEGKKIVKNEWVIIVKRRLIALTTCSIGSYQPPHPPLKQVDNQTSIFKFMDVYRTMGHQSKYVKRLDIETCRMEHKPPLFVTVNKNPMCLFNITQYASRENKTEEVFEEPIVSDQIKVDDEEEEDDVEENTHEDTLSRIVNEKENILKSLFHAIKIHGENEIVLRNQIKSLENRYQKTLQYVQQVLEKNGEDHKILANSFINLNQQSRENILNEVKLEMEAKYKAKLDQMEHMLEQRLSRISDGYLEQFANLKRDFITYGVIFVVILLFLYSFTIPHNQISISGDTFKELHTPNSTAGPFFPKKVSKKTSTSATTSSLLQVLYSFFSQDVTEPIDSPLQEAKVEFGQDISSLPTADTDQNSTILDEFIISKKLPTSRSFKSKKKQKFFKNQE